MECKDVPIGYWVTQLGRLIELTLHRASVLEGLSRRDWQLLHVVRREPATIQAIIDALEHSGAPATSSPTSSSAGLCATAGLSAMRATATD